MPSQFSAIGFEVTSGEDLAALASHVADGAETITVQDRKSTRLNSSHVAISYAVFCLKKKNLVIGACLAGLLIGIGAKRRGHDVIILSLVPPKRSHCAASQVAIQSSLANVIKESGANE